MILKFQKIILVKDVFLVVCLSVLGMLLLRQAKGDSTVTFNDTTDGQYVNGLYGGIDWGNANPKWQAWTPGDGFTTMSVFIENTATSGSKTITLSSGMILKSVQFSNDPGAVGTVKLSTAGQADVSISVGLQNVKTLITNWKTPSTVVTITVSMTSGNVANVVFDNFVYGIATSNTASSSPSAVTTIPIALGETTIRPSTTNGTSFSLNLPNGVPAGQQCRIIFDTRLPYPSYAGQAYALWFRVKNASQVTADPTTKDLLNKDLDFICKDGRDFTWFAGGCWGSLYSPDFDASKRQTSDSIYAIPDPAHQPYRYVIDITSYVSAGSNSLVFYNYTTAPYDLLLKNISVEVGPSLPPPAGLADPSPTGALTSYIAAVPTQPNMTVSLYQYGSIGVMMGGYNWITTSRVSNPGGASNWTSTSASGAAYSVSIGSSKSVTWNAANCRIDRTVKNCGDHIEIDDVVRNQGTTDRPVILEHRTALPSGLGAPSSVKLTGFNSVSGATYRRSPGNPTSIASWATAACAIGLVAEDDLFRMHSANFSESGQIGLSDSELVIPKGDTAANWRTLEWSIYPQTQGDYWSIINAIRRNFTSNTTIPGPIVFSGQDGTQATQWYSDWITARGVKWLVSGQESFSAAEQAQYGGPGKNRYADGTAVTLAKEWLKSFALWSSKVHSLQPNVSMLMYMHDQICTEPGTWSNPPVYADSKMLDSTGKQASYSMDGVACLSYLSTLSNSYGKALQNTYKSLFEDTSLGLDGIYNDEFYWTISQYSYLDGNGNPWDGCTGVIDSNHNLVKKVSNTGLLQQSHRVALLDSVASLKKKFIFNGAAETRTILAKKVPSFCETFSYSDLFSMHLSTPLGYGNHDMTTNDVARSRMTRKILDRGGLILVVGWTDTPSGQHYVPLMYPLTPIEIRSGMVLGEERIVTDRSGIYGWAAGNDASVYIFDGNGVINGTRSTLVKYQSAGLWRWEIRMPSDHLAILVKK